MNFKQTFKAILALFIFFYTTCSFAETVWIDVRTLEEYNANHIEGDLLIPHSQILQKISKIYPDKETDIHLYCRSGNRAGIAKYALNEAGYTKVFNEGSIERARKIQAQLKQ